MNRMDVAAAVAAKCVVRQVAEFGKDGKPTGQTKDAPIKADEVLACRVYPEAGEIVVVTTSGEKLTGAASKQVLADAEKAAAEAAADGEGASK